MLSKFANYRRNMQMTDIGLQNLFSSDYSTVEYAENFKIIGPVTLPIKVKDKKSTMKVHLFSTKSENYLACVIGDINGSEKVPVRISSACVFGFILKSLLCDCLDQYEESIQFMLSAGSGLLIYCLDQHGKGIGLEAHFLVYAEGQRQKKGLFSEIYKGLGLKADYRSYEDVFNIIKYFKTEKAFHKISMLTESPDKIQFFLK